MKQLLNLFIEFIRIFIGFLLAITILTISDIYFQLKKLYEIFK